MTEGQDTLTMISEWLGSFERALCARDVDAASALFGNECFWRDLVAFTWNVRTLEGREAIAAMLRANLEEISPSSWRIEEANKLGDGLHEAWLTF